jgi:hypothetical protein
MPANNLSIPLLLTVYVGVLGTVALCAGYAYSSADFKSEQGSTRPAREKTVLDERIATAREVKEALRRPIPRPEPLGPITAKVANALGRNVVAVPATKTTKITKIPRAALNAMAMDHSGISSSVSYPTVDRAGAGGW